MMWDNKVEISQFLSGNHNYHLLKDHEYHHIIKLNSIIFIHFQESHE